MGLIHRERERDGRTAKTRVKFEMVYAQIDNILFETVYIMRSFGSASEKILLFLFYSSAATLRIWVCTLEIAMIVTKNDGIEWIFSTVITILKWEKDHEFEPIVCVYRERERYVDVDFTDFYHCERAIFSNFCLFLNASRYSCLF